MISFYYPWHTETFFLSCTNVLVTMEKLKSQKQNLISSSPNQQK